MATFSAADASRARMPTGLGRARAIRALNSIGASTEGLCRADSVTNEVWLTPDLVVRVNRDAGLRLHREAVLSHALPIDVGYPAVIQHGGEVGDDWLVLERVPGRPLSRWWPSMTEAQRREAVRQLATKLRLIHCTPCPDLDGLNDVPQLLDPGTTGYLAVQRLLGAIDRMGRLQHIDPMVALEAAELVQTNAAALDPFDARTVVHGDLTFENILWDGERITAVLDFEFSRPGPRDLDLDVLMRFISLPQLHVAADYEADTLAADYQQVPWWLADDYPELFNHPRQFDRMRIYSIAWDVREVLQFPPSAPVANLHPQHPYRRLIRVLQGSSYLDRLNGGTVLDF